jgi:hypothetical protein
MDASVRDAATPDHDASMTGSKDAVSDRGVGLDAGAEVDAPAGPKTPIVGLIDMQTITWHNSAAGEPTFNIGNVDEFPGLLGGIVINATWNSIQPQQSDASADLNFSTIDNALVLIRAYNKANPTAPLGVKLRVYGGTDAPDWAKSLDGAPIAIMRNPAGCGSPPCNLTIGAYWAADYVKAWRAFQGLLAARYDAEPLIRQVAVTSCASQTDEPFVPTTDATSRANLMAAGLTDALQQGCLSNAVEDYAAWTTSLIDYTFNVYVNVGGGGTDQVFPTTVMKACRATLGARCVLDNHALEYPLLTGDDDVYTAMQTLGGPIDFQTQSPVGFDCEWTETVAQGVALGASAIELWPDKMFDGFDSLKASQIEQLNAEFTTPLALPDAGSLPDGGFCPGFQ